MYTSDKEKLGTDNQQSKSCWKNHIKSSIFIWRSWQKNATWKIFIVEEGLK